VHTPEGKQPSGVARELCDDELPAVVEGFRLAARNAMADSDPIGLVTWLAKRLNASPLAYLHLMRADLLGQQHGDVLTPAREHFNSVLVASAPPAPGPG
jgi:hypothetical protein